MIQVVLICLYKYKSVHWIDAQLEQRTKSLVQGCRSKPCWHFFAQKSIQ